VCSSDLGKAKIDSLYLVADNMGDLVEMMYIVLLEYAPTMVERMMNSTKLDAIMKRKRSNAATTKDEMDLMTLLTRVSKDLSDRAPQGQQLSIKKEGDKVVARYIQQSPQAQEKAARVAAPIPPDMRAAIDGLYKVAMNLPKLSGLPRFV
jgi:hypothetical protein